jgi:hypothetical protein
MNFQRFTSLVNLKELRPIINILHLGGVTQDKQTTFSNKVFRFSLIQRKWEEVASLPAPRYAKINMSDNWILIC